jgi:hypothetical protein
MSDFIQLTDEQVQTITTLTNDGTQDHWKAYAYIHNAIKDLPPSSPKAPTTPAAPPPLPITVKVPGSGGGTHTSQKPPSSVMHFSADHYKPFTPPPKPQESSGWQYTVKVITALLVPGALLAEEFELPDLYLRKQV